MLKCVIKRFEQLSTRELYEFLSLRSSIFVVEQNCAYQDPDGYDYNTLHFLFYNNENALVAYTRVFEFGIKYNDALAISRVVVDSNYRNNGYGYEIMRNTIAHIKQHLIGNLIRISAQAHLQKFYANLGFKTCSDIYLEDDIPHVEMMLEI